MKQNRISYIDICKALGIFTIVLGHVSATKTIMIWQAAFHVPLFFFLSGLCFNESRHRKVYDFIKSRFKTLIIPYIIFSVLLYYLWVGIQSLSYQNLLKCMLFPASNTSSYGAVNWFLPALFFAEISFILYGKFVKYSFWKMCIFIVLVTVLGFCYPLITNYRLPLAIDSAIIGLAFYSLGWIIRRIDLKKIINYISCHKFIFTIIALILIILSVPISLLNGSVNIRTLKYGNVFLYMFNALFITIVVLIISVLLDLYSNRIKIFNILKVVGKHTMVILLLNSILARFYLTITESRVVITNKLLFNINSIIVSIIITVICVALSKLINKHMPFLLGKAKK